LGPSHSLGGKPTNATIVLPEFDEVSTDHLFGVVDRRTIVEKIETCRRTLEGGVGIQNVKPINSHDQQPGVPRLEM
jgi:hypothetical protein